MVVLAVDSRQAGRLGRFDTALAGLCVWLAFTFLFIWGAGVATSGELELGPGEKWVVLASKQNLQEAIDVARNYDGAKVVSSQNGWYAIVMGPSSLGSIDDFRGQYSGTAIPDDAYMAKGANFLTQMWPDSVESPSAKPDAASAVKPEKEFPRDQLRITFQSLARYKVDLSFFSQTNSNRAWPGDGKIFPLYDSEKHSFALDCQPGEKICWGAAERNNPDQGYSGYWGAGIDGTKGCSNCCLRCGADYGLRTLGD